MRIRSLLIAACNARSYNPGMSATRPRATLADYIVVGISPTLIVFLVGSLVFFLIEVLYHGSFEVRLNFILGLFVMATVCVARIAMEEGHAYAAMFAAPLGLVVGIAMMRFVQITGPLAGISPAINWGFLALIWWCSHKLTWDCTLLDDSTDASGQGLLQSLVWEGDATGDGTTTVEANEPAAPPEPFWKTWFAPDKRPHTPGVWVVIFSLAALPIFGIGQWFLPAGDLASRRYVFWLMVIYVGSGLGLLLTTSFLSIRKYLRQRRLEMPLEMAGAWLGVGVAMIGALLVFCFLLPRPNPEYSVTQLPISFGSPDRNTSQHAVGKDGQKQGPAPNGQQPGNPQAPNPQTQNKQPPSGQQQPSNQQPMPGQNSGNPSQPMPASNPASPMPGQPSPMSPGNSPQSQANQNPGGTQPMPGQDGDAGGKTGKSSEKVGPQSGAGNQGGQSSGKQGESNSKPPNAENGKQPPPSQGQPEPQSNPPNPQQPNQEKNNQEKPPPANKSSNPPNSVPPSTSQPPPASQPPSTPPPPTPPASTLPSLSSLFGSLGELLKWVGYAIIAIIALFLAIKYRAELVEAWTKLLAELRELWAKLFGGSETPKAGAEVAAAPTSAPARPFAAYADPFATGAVRQMTLAQLVRYTFEAVEAWARERNCPRNDGQTPLEFAQYLGQLAPFLAQEVKQLADWYGQVAYARTNPPAQAAGVMQQLWRLLAASP